MQGIVASIWIAAAAGQPMEERTEAVALAGRGLEGDRYSVGKGYYSDRPTPGGGREITLIEAEVLESLQPEHAIQFDPAECRRNVVTRGISLPELIGKRFRIGSVLCEGIRICEPCTYLEGLTGKAVNAPLVHRGGLRANVLVGGTLRRGDQVSPAEAFGPETASSRPAAST